MNKNFVTTLGILIAVMPFITIPTSFKTPIYFLLGSLIAYTSYREHHQKKKIHAGKRIKRPVGAITPVPADSIVTPIIDVSETKKTK
mgnify:CR=1 FL=1